MPLSARLSAVLLILSLSVSPFADAKNKTRNPLGCSLRLAMLVFTGAIVGVSMYSVGVRHAQLAPIKDSEAYNSQHRFVTEFGNDGELDAAFLKAVFHDRRYYQGWVPRYLRLTLAYHAALDEEVQNLATIRGIPLEDDVRFEKYLGIQGPPYKKEENRPLVEEHFPGMLQHQRNVDELMALICKRRLKWAESVGKLDPIHYDNNPGNAATIWTAVHSFKDDWYRIQKIDYLERDVLTSKRYTSDMGTYLRYRWQIRNENTGYLIRQLFERHSEKVEEVLSWQGPGMLSRYPSVTDSSRFEAMAGGHPYGVNDDNLEVIDSTLNSILLDFRKQTFGDDQVTNQELLDAFLKAEKLP